MQQCLKHFMMLVTLASVDSIMLQSNMYITGTFGNTKTWSLYTGGRYTETL